VSFSLTTAFSLMGSSGIIRSVNTLPNVPSPIGLTEKGKLSLTVFDITTQHPYIVLLRLARSSECCEMLRFFPVLPWSFDGPQF